MCNLRAIKKKQKKNPMTHWEITSTVTQLWDVLVFWVATGLRMLLLI